MSREDNWNDEDGRLSFDEVLDLAAKVDMTRHYGGIEATNELLGLCHIDGDKVVLDVGCGVGITACYLAKTVGCRVVGVDISASMIQKARQRAKRTRLDDKVEFKVADARDLPFEDDTFDVIIVESATQYLADKQATVNEYTRVTKPGGFVGLNEPTWLKTPPEDVARNLHHSARAIHLTVDGWKALLEKARLADVIAKSYAVSSRTESVSQVKLVGFKHMMKVAFRTLVLYIGDPDFKKLIKETTGGIPRDIYEYLGYGLYVGHKESS
jgi:arsenite methyltransferase